MEIYFRTKSLQEVCSKEKEMLRSLGAAMTRKLKPRLAELKAADALADISYLPPPRLHELTKRDGVFSIDLEYPNRLLLIPANDPVPRKADGGIDRKQVNAVEIIDIEDTHDPKNQRRRRRG